MQTSQHTAESFWKLYLALSTDEKKAVLTKFFVENDLYQDISDSEIAEERKNGSFTAWEDVQRERNARRAA